VTGVVAQIHAVTGEAVLPDQPLFEMRLTHEEHRHDEDGRDEDGEEEEEVEDGEKSES